GKDAGSARTWRYGRDRGHSLGANAAPRRHRLRFAKPSYNHCVVRLRLAVLAAALAAAALAGQAQGATFTARDLTIPGAGGTPLAATLYEPTGAPPAGGFPAVVMFHGLGGTRASVDPLARSFFADQGYVVLAFDARGHGASGGLWDLDGPNANADARAVYDFLAARPEVAPTKIGAFGVSLGGGAVWNS